MALSYWGLRLTKLCWGLVGQKSWHTTKHWMMASGTTLVCHGANLQGLFSYMLMVSWSLRSAATPRINQSTRCKLALHLVGIWYLKVNQYKKIFQCIAHEEIFHILYIFWTLKNMRNVLRRVEDLLHFIHDQKMWIWLVHARSQWFSHITKSQTSYLKTVSLGFNFFLFYVQNYKTLTIIVFHDLKTKIFNDTLLNYLLPYYANHQKKIRTIFPLLTWRVMSEINDWPLLANKS